MRKLNKINRIKKYSGLFLILPVFILSACATTPEDPSHILEQNKEQLFASTHSYAELANYYKGKLTEDKDNVDLRLKLVDAYIKMQNYIVAEFYLKPMLQMKSPPALALYYKAKILFKQNHLADAKRYAVESINIQDMPQTHELLGELYTYDESYEQAIAEFTSAWKKGFDETKSINNIAVVYLVQKNYQKVVDLLYPIYYAGNRNKKLVNNLAYALDQLGQKSAAKMVTQMPDMNQQ